MQAWHSTSSVACSMPNRLGEHRLQLGRALLRVVQAQRARRAPRGPRAPATPSRATTRADGAPPRRRSRRLERGRARRRRRRRRAPPRAAPASCRGARSTRRTSTSTAIDERRDRVEALRIEQRAHRSPTTTTASEPSASSARCHERGAQVEVAVRGARQHERAPDVDDHARDADDEHAGRVEVVRAAEPPNRLDHDRDRADEAAARRWPAPRAPRPARTRTCGARWAAAARTRARPARGPSASTSEVRCAASASSARLPNRKPADELDHEKGRVRAESDQQGPAASSERGSMTGNLGARGARPTPSRSAEPLGAGRLAAEQLLDVAAHLLLASAASRSA